MDPQGLLSKIISQYSRLTKAEKKVADKVLADPGKILYMSITELGEESGVGDASVFRFCKSLHLKGYQDFKLQLSLGMSKESAKPTDAALFGDSSMEQRLQLLQDKVNLAINETICLLKADCLDRIINYMLAAKRIFFCGVGTSMLSAVEAMNRFLRISTNVYSFVDAHMQAMAASLFNAEDLVFVFSYSGNTKDSVQIAKLAHEAGATVVGISRYSKSPLTMYIQELLLCGSEESPLQGGSAAGKISQLFIMDVLYNEYYRRTEKESTLNNARTSLAVSEKLF